MVRISNNVYRTPKKWPLLWKNNPELIHDPNKIYAGFTLYYVPDRESPVPLRDPASKTD